MRPVELSLVVPTFNERANIRPLLTRLRSALEALEWDVLFVDDSTDGTDTLIQGYAAHDSRIGLLHRSENRGGLSGAVVEGMRLVQGKYVCVLDADLQHPPAYIPHMLEQAKRTDADIIVASRYCAGGE